MDSQIFVQIHEFSTGIYVLGDRDKWVSAGFTGKYMNATIDQIPHVVDRSIENKEFKVAEGASRDQPAIIGRVVGSDGSAWSVVAIVTRGRDDYGRSPSLYRYFLCEGEDGLPKILAWIRQYEQQHHRMPVFNPFEQKKLGEPNSSQVVVPIEKGLSSDVQSALQKQSTAWIIQAETYNLEQLNQLATEKAKTNNQPIAWAFNVEALEMMGRFQIIQAASPQAYELFQRLKNSSPKALPPVVSDEQALISAIKAFMNNPSAVKPQHVEAIANALSNDKVTEKYWQQIFDAQGADSAIKGTYTPQFVNLLTLRAIIIPETLPEYLTWLHKGDKQYQTYRLADTCQNQIRALLKGNSELAPKFEGKLKEGFQVLLNLVMQGQGITLFKQGPWYKFSEQFIRDVEYDLTLISNNSQVSWQSLSFQLTDQFWQTLRNELKFYFNQRDLNHSPKDKYQPIAKFFDNLEEPIIAAFFYQLGYGKVPKRIFKQLQINDWEHEIYGITVKRETTPDEQVFDAFKYLFNANVPLPLLLILILISLFLGSVFRPLSLGFNVEGNQPTPTLSPTPTPTPTPIPQPNDIPDDKKNTALSKFDETNKVIQELVKKLQTDLKLENKDGETKIVESLKDVLQDKQLQYPIGNQAQNLEKQKWVNAIYKYQYIYNKNNAVGFLEKGQTYDKLKEDITKHIKDMQATEIDQKKKEDDALKRFEDTSKVIQELVEQLKTELNLPNKEGETKIVVSLKDVLQDPDLKYAGVITQEENQSQNLEAEKRKWVKAIYKYQYLDKKNNAVGFLEKGQTYDKLKQNITERIKNEKCLLWIICLP